MLQQGDDKSQRSICDNVQQVYLTRLKNAAKRLRQIERDHINRIGRLYGVVGEIRLPDVSDLDNK